MDKAPGEGSKIIVDNSGRAEVHELSEAEKQARLERLAKKSRGKGVLSPGEDGKLVIKYADGSISTPDAPDVVLKKETRFAGDEKGNLFDLKKEK